MEFRIFWSQRGGRVHLDAAIQDGACSGSQVEEMMQSRKISLSTEKREAPAHADKETLCAFGAKHYGLDVPWGFPGPNCDSSIFNIVTKEFQILCFCYHGVLNLMYYYVLVLSLFSRVSSSFPVHRIVNDKNAYRISTSMFLCP